MGDYTSLPQNEWRQDNPILQNVFAEIIHEDKITRGFIKQAFVYSYGSPLPVDFKEEKEFIDERNKNPRGIYFSFTLIVHDDIKGRKDMKLEIPANRFKLIIPTDVEKMIFKLEHDL